MIGNLSAAVFTPGAVLGDYESIATVSVTSAGGASSIVFNSVPSTYQHIQIRCITGVSSTARYGISFNSDTNLGNYDQHSLYGDGSSAAGFYGNNHWGIGLAAAGTAFGAAIVDILDYRNTNKYKTWRSLQGQDTNGSGFMLLTSGFWQSTSAISSITIYPSENSTGSGASFQQNSHFALYGIKG